VRFVTVPAGTHRPKEYSDVFDGYKAVQLVDESGQMRGELVWRLATGNTIEITELGVFDESLRRKGWGSKLLEAGLASIRSFFADKPYWLRRIYVFCDSVNGAARAFYEAHGFELACMLPGFYHYCDAALYVLDAEAMEGRGARGAG
jgi:ribosomal protein S18 acetylase RimI-like enzyme